MSVRRISTAVLILFAALVTLFRWAHSDGTTTPRNEVSNTHDAPKGIQGMEQNLGSAAKGGRTHTEDTSYGQSQTLPLDEIRQRVKDIAACVRLQDQRRVANSLLAQSTALLNDYARDRLDQNLQLTSWRIDKLQNEGACTGLDSNAIAGTIYPLLLEMARQGDAEAANCYVAADFELNDDQRKPSRIEEYRRNATTLIQAQLERGDWRMVKLLEAAYDRDNDQHRGRYSWFREISMGNRAQAYGYAKLLHLGATNGDSDAADRFLEARKAELSPDQIVEQDVWAEREFKAHFTNSPLDEHIPTCALYSDARVYHRVSKSIK